MYTGGLAALGCVAAFLSEDLKKEKKAVLAFSLLVCGLIFSWNPAFMTFSLLKKVESGWFRYGYMGSLILVFVATTYFVSAVHNIALTFSKAGLCFIVLILF